MSDIRKYINIIDQYGVDDETSNYSKTIEPQGLTRYVDLIESSIRVDESFKDAEVKFSDENDPAEVKKYIEQFKQLAQKNIIKGPDKDIGKWIKAGWEAFKELVDTSSKVTTKRQGKRRVKSDSIMAYEDDKIMVVIPLTKEASCFYGKNTQWCTAATQSQNYFNDYFGNQEITLFYVFVKSDGSKFAAASYGGDAYEYFDEEDSRMNGELFTDETGVTEDDLYKWYSENESIIEKARVNFSPSGIVKSVMEKFKSGEYNPSMVVASVNEQIHELYEQDPGLDARDLDLELSGVDENGNFVVDCEWIIDKLENSIKYINGDEHLEFFNSSPDYDNLLDELDTEMQVRIADYLIDNYTDEISELLYLDDDETLTRSVILNNFDEIMEGDIDDELGMGFRLAEEDAMRSYAEGQLVKDINSYIRDQLGSLNLEYDGKFFNMIDTRNYSVPIAHNNVVEFFEALKDFELEEPDIEIDEGIDHDFLPEALSDHLSEILPEKDDE